MKRLISWLLALTLIFGLVPMSAMAATDVEIGEGDPDISVGFEELLKGYTAENPIDLTNDLRDATETVVVPAGKTMYFIAYGIAGMEMTINDGEAVLCGGNPRVAYAWTITNDGEADASYTIKVGFPAGSDMNPVVIEEMSWYKGEVSQAAGDFDGYFYTYTATETGVVTLYFDAVYDEETGEAIDFGEQRDIKVTNMNTYAQYSLLQDGVDYFGLQLQVPVAAGQTLMINTAWVKDAEGNYYPEATYSWTGNFAYPAGSEQNPISIEWAWDEAYANATASVTVAAGETVYFTGTAGMILTVDGVETEMTETGVFSITNSGDAEATYALALATPIGAYENPEVIENIDGYTDSNSLAEEGTYYYIWTATEAGTVTLAVTDGATINVTNQNTYAQYNLAEADWSNKVWNVQENLQIEVVEGDVLKIEVVGLMSFETYSAPAIDYTLTGAFEAAEPEVPVIPAEATFKITGASLALQDLIKMKMSVSVTTTQKIVKTGGLFWTKEQYAQETDFTVNSTLAYNAVSEEATAAYSVFGEGILAQSFDVEYYFIPYVETEYGYVYGSVVTPSPLKYCTSALKSGSADLKSLIVDLLNYADAARNYFVLAQGMPVPASPINSILSDSQKVVAWDEALRTNPPTYDTANGGYAIKPSGVNVNLGEAISLQVKFNGNDVAGGIYWNQDDFTANESNLSLDNKTADVTNIVVSGNTTQLIVGGLYAYNIFDFYYIRAYDASNLMSRTVGASVAAYLTTTLKSAETKSDDTNIALTALCKAMLVYGKNASTNSTIGRG